jgi:hypothetical protein
MCAPGHLFYEPEEIRTNVPLIEDESLAVHLRGLPWKVRK